MTAAVKTRLLKAECLGCGYVCRVTRTHVGRVGLPLCPCNHEPMVSAEYTDWYRDLMASQVDQVDGSIVRGPWQVTVRVAQDCAGCGGSIPPGGSSRRLIVRMDGALAQLDTCDGCHQASAHGERAYTGGTCGDERWRTDLVGRGEAPF